MKRIETSILVWGIYLVALGLGFILAPQFLLELFGYKVKEDLWIRIIGILSVVLGMYYTQIAMHKITLLYKWKLAGHSFGIVCMSLFLFSGVADQRILGTIFIELAAAGWTALLLKQQNKKSGPSA